MADSRDDISGHKPARSALGVHRYAIYCDEAFTSQSGLRYHHYYGGVIIEEQEIPTVEKRLSGIIAAHHWTREPKWQGVDAESLPLYRDFINAFFDEVAKGRCRIRIMFLDKRWQPARLSPEHRQFGYHILYYMFVSRAFGVQQAPFGERDKLILRLFFDKLPDRRAKNERFKIFLRDMPQTARFQRSQVIIPEDGISEIDSRNHRIAQAIDVIIGALGYRMNQLHKVVGLNGKRGNRTRAKEGLYRVIRDRMQLLGVRNIGITTVRRHGISSLWLDPVRIWKFVPSQAQIDPYWDSKWTKK